MNEFGIAGRFSKFENITWIWVLNKLLLRGGNTFEYEYHSKFYIIPHFLFFFSLLVGNLFYYSGYLEIDYFVNKYIL